MKTKRTPAFMTLAIGLLVSAMAVHADAQTTWTVSIQEGVVSVNGEVVPADDVPASLNLSDVNVVLGFSGLDQAAPPVVELNGMHYVLVPGGLREANEDEVKAYGVSGRGTAFYLARDAYMDAHVQAMQAPLREIEQLSRELAEQGPGEVADRMRKNAEEASRMAAVLPQLDTQLYLADVRKENKELYGRMVDEWNREHEVRSLVNQIRALPDGDEREGLEAELRNRLGQMFDFKQENRRREIDQLEAELDELNGRVIERERRREEIIERRFQELLGHASNW